ncbi:MAG: glycosyltransferase family 4 protein [Bacteroidaceae bacterium]
MKYKENARVMSKRRTKVFLGALVNCTNAQNLNCLALAKHLDKSKYEIMTMTVYSGDLPVEKIQGVHYLQIRYPAKIWRPFYLIIGLLRCDVEYLPKPEYCCLCRFMLRILRKAAFQTIEGVFTGTNLDKALQSLHSISRIVTSLTYTRNTYSITQAMCAKNETALGIISNPKVLYLGVESQYFKNDISRKQLTDVVIVGGNLKYKGLDDFLILAQHIPSLNFHIVGSGLGAISPTEEVHRLGLHNVICHGTLSHQELKELLKTVQVHIFPSHSEGFPKVTLECAAAGVPSIVYDDYGADEWITTGEDGFVVHSLEQIENILYDLLKFPQKLQPLSNSAYSLSLRFSWDSVIKDWEAVIDDLRRG